MEKFYSIMNPLTYKVSDENTLWHVLNKFYKERIKSQYDVSKIRMQLI